MDAHTLEILGFHKVRELLAGYAASSLGKDLALQAEPGTNVEKIREAVALVSEMVEALDRGQTPPFGGLRDVRLLARRAAIGAMLGAEQLLEVAETLTCTGNMYRYRMRLDERWKRLLTLLVPIEDLGPAAKAITGCIDARGHVLDLASPELAQARRKLAEVDDRVQKQIKRLLRDPELRKVLRYPHATVSGDHYVLPVAVNYRHKIPGVVHRTSSTGETVFIEPAAIAGLSAEHAVLKGEEEREIRRVLRRLSGEVGQIARPLGQALDVMAQLDLVTAKARFSRDYNMTAPDVNAEGRLWLRQARHPLLEHLFRSSKSEVRIQKSEASRQSAVGSQQSPVGSQSALGGAISSQSAASSQQSAASSQQSPVGSQSALDGTITSQQNSPLPTADCRLPKAAKPQPLSPLHPSSGGEGQGEGGLTPTPPHLLPTESGDCRRQTVPIDVHLGDSFNLLIITGPNTGGKTVTLKTTGLLSLMAQTGMHIPAGAGSSVPAFQQVLADIGDEQSLEQSLSTFSSHVSRIASILAVADAQSLVLLDELGAGTDPSEGAALGRAILDELDRLGCRAMVTTHLGDLKTYAFTNERAENAAVEFDSDTLLPTYRLHIGQFGMSNALKIARRLKLPRDLLRRARRYLRRRQRRAPGLASLQQKREEAEQARAEALQARHEAEISRTAYEEKLAEIERAAAEAANLHAARARLQANDPVRVTRFDKPGRVVRVDHKKNLAVVNVGLGQWEVPLDEVFPLEG